jgi:hypothetical protein
MPQYLVTYPVDWKGEILEPGAVIEAVSPDDDVLVEYVGKFSKIAAMPGEAPPGGEDGSSNGDLGESGAASATPPMTSTEMPSHVGRRVRHPTSG